MNEIPLEGAYEGYIDLNSKNAAPTLEARAAFFYFFRNSYSLSFWADVRSRDST